MNRIEAPVEIKLQRHMFPVVNHNNILEENKELGCTVKIIKKREEVKRVIITVKDPAVVEDEDFLALINGYTRIAEIVEIDLGIKNKKSEYYADDLLEYRHDEIERMHAQEFASWERIKLMRDKWYSLSWKEHIFVVMKKPGQDESIEAKTAPGDDIIFEEIKEPQDDSLNIDANQSIDVLDEPDSAVKKRVKFFMDDNELTNESIEDILALVNGDNVVEIVKDETRYKRILPYSFDIERESQYSDIIIYLNFQEEQIFKEILIPILTHFIKEGNTIAIDRGSEDMSMFMSDPKESGIYKTVSFETKCTMQEEVRILDNGRRDSFIVLEPQ